MLKLNVLIEARREGYSTSQCGRTMTVGELIEYLGQYDEDTPVFISNDNGYTYGPITENDIHEKEEDEDD